MQEFGKPLLYALLVHLVLLALMLLGGMNWQKFQQPRLAGLNIEAVVVDSVDFNKKISAAKKQLERQKRREGAIERRRKQLEAQERREKQRQVEAERIRQQLAQQRREAAEQEQQQQAAEKARLAELEKRRLAQQEQAREQQAELERIRKQRAAQERKIREEAEKLRKLAEERKAREKAAADKRMRDALKAEANALAQAEVLGDLRDQYILEITNSVTRNWYRPPTARKGLRCRMQVRQIPGGEVVRADVMKSQCNADEATQRSIIAAVMRAGVLPYRGFEKVFVREIEFEFKYDGED